ncbi:PucR family transcriptional regulator [Rhodococcus qingshengii]|uniref:PucR family transcriptional regulator n=1 Tax=Rhodococcus qingshengii TaxID=334542 RepID=UPI002FEFF626
MDVTDVEEEDTIRRLCREVSDELEALTERAVQQIRSEIPAYSAVPVAEQGNYIRKQLSAMLCAVAENETITTEDTDRNRELGRRRAMQGLPLSDVIETYHIASRELWDTMVQRSTKPTHELLQAGGKLWDLVHVATSAVAVGHSEATRSEQAIRAGVRYRFFETLHSATDMELSNARELAQTLGFDTQKSFQALSAVEEEWSEAQVENLQRTLDSVHAVAHCSRHGSRVIVMCQGEPTEVIHAIMRDHPRTSLGIGMPRVGLVGAAQSITDAERTLQLATAPGTTVSFADEWLIATLATHQDELLPLLQAGASVAEEHSHLMDAVRAFARSGFSVSAAARDIHLHANSVTYRLDRWQHLTGWDARTLDGLMKSIVSLELFHRRTLDHHLTPNTRRVSSAR